MFAPLCEGSWVFFFCCCCCLFVVVVVVVCLFFLKIEVLCVRGREEEREGGVFCVRVRLNVYIKDSGKSIEKQDNG